MVTSHARMLQQLMIDSSAVVGGINPLMTTSKPQSDGPLYSNTVIGTLAVDCYIWYSE